MYCTHCGTENEAHLTTCSSCGQALPIFTEKVPNYLVQAILVTFCCCVPFGIPAIVYAAQVNTKLQAGDVVGAKESSKKAMMWSWIAFGCGAAVGLVYFGLAMLGAFADM